MDVDRLADNSESKSNCWNTWVDYNRQSGAMASYLENLVPEQLFSTEGNQLDGISAVKALAVASNQGQKIYTLTSANSNLLTEISINSDSRQEIQRALSSGKEVTVHEQPINAFGWTGSGYLIIDPDSGAGAYKISGGLNGGFLSDDSVGVWTFIGMSAGILSSVFGIVLLIIAAAIAIMLIVDLLLNFNNNCNSGGYKAMIAASVAVALLGVFVGVIAAIVLMYTALLLGTAVLTVDDKLCG